MLTAASTAEIANVRAQTAGPRRTLWVSASGTLLVLAVFSAVVTSVGASNSALGGSVSDETWTLSGMSLGLAVALLTVGALADDIGRRKVLVVSGGLLTITSGLAALAPSADVLIAARILQGISGAGVIAASLGAIGDAFPPGPQRAFASSVWGAAVGAGIAIGPLAGGALSQAIGWRSSYWLQAIAAAMLIPAALTIDESRSQSRRPLDLWGAGALAAAMAGLTAGLIEGRNSWSSASAIVPLVVGVVLLGAFATIEARRRDPMLELSRFRHPLFVASLSGALATGLAVIGLMSVTPLVLQLGLHVSVLGSAAVLAAWSATSTAVALATRPLLGRLNSPSVLALGFAVCAVGEFALTNIGVESSWAQLLPGLAVVGIGSGLANAGLGRVAVESVPRERAGMGSGANNTARYLGGAAGVALVAALVTSGGARPADLLSGYSTATIVCGALCVLGALVAAACRRA